jgi:hypothetical protein
MNSEEDIVESIRELKMKADHAASDVLILYRKIQDLTNDIQILKKNGK